LAGQGDVKWEHPRNALDGPRLYHRNGVGSEEFDGYVVVRVQIPTRPVLTPYGV